MNDQEIRQAALQAASLYGASHDFAKGFESGFRAAREHIQSGDLELARESLEDAVRLIEHMGGFPGHQKKTLRRIGPSRR